MGSVSGREEDKFNCYGIPVVRGPVLGLPLVEEKCLAWMECRLLPATSAQEKYDTLFGEVVSAAADARVFVEGRWQFDDDKLNTLHHLGAGTLLVVPDGLRMVMFHIRRPVVKYLRVHVLLRVDIDLFLIRHILKAQLIKTASFIGLRPYRHLRLRSRQVPGERLSSWYVRPMTSGWSGSPFRKSTITSWPTRGIARLPNPGPAHACDTRTQHELSSVIP